MLVTGPSLIYDLDYKDIQQVLDAWGAPGYRARQVWEGLYVHLYNSASQFTSLPLEFRHRLEQQFSFSHLKPVQSLDSSDHHTQKILFRLPDGQAIETVRMGYRHRRTLCISTQAGCAMGCVFCATGQMGFRRHLTSGEITEQVLYFERVLRQSEEHVTNVVIMGMGEPFHNYDATMAAIDRLNQADGFNFGARRFTVSTVGLVPVIRRFAADKRQVNLAVSLHAAEDELRSSMLPVNKRYGVDELLQACRDYIQQTKRRITFEWALIRDVNDTPEQARLLASKLHGMLCHVNVIQLNPTKKYRGESTTHARALEFQAELERQGIPCTIRLRRGIDIQAGCGQLATETTTSC